MFDLTGKIALVSGGAKGIGKGIVIALKNSGAKVIIADIDDVAGNKTKQELNVEFMHLDVTHQSACETVIDDVVKEYGKLDILCSNTGIFPQATIKEMTEADWDKMHTVNLKGMFFLVKAALRVMEKQKQG
ncbi:SDR family NAD(P)-dependent oxidoreductase, partial [Klebsiella variicola subsp. variicola]